MKSRSSSSCRKLFILAVGIIVVPDLANATDLVDNLFSSADQPQSIANIHGVFPGTGFGVGVSMNDNAYSVDRLTFEFLAQSPPGSDLTVEILAFADPNSKPRSGQVANFVTYGQMGNPTLSSKLTHSPNDTVFVDYTPISPIILEPHTDYVLAVVETGNAAPAMLFGSGRYIFGGDIPPAPARPPFNYGEYQYASPNWTVSPINSPILELEGTAVPERCSTFATLALSLGILMIGTFPSQNLDLARKPLPYPPIVSA